MHENVIELQRLENGDLEFRDMYGRVLAQVPQAPQLVGDSEEALRAANSAAGINVGPTTLRPRWDGTRLDLHYAIDVMHPRATGELARRIKPTPN